MLISIVIALALAKIKHFRLTPIVRTWALYPFFGVELVYWILQIGIFTRHYAWIPYAGYLKTAYFLALLVPILRYKLYAPALAGSASVLLGTGLNRLAIYANGGKMPVFPTLSRLTGYYNPSPFSSVDSLHSVGTSASHLKILCDYIDIGWSILSVGDLFIHAFSLIILYYTIKKIN